MMFAFITVFCMWLLLQVLILGAQVVCKITPKEMKESTKHYNPIVRWLVYTYPALYTLKFKK